MGVVPDSLPAYLSRWAIFGAGMASCHEQGLVCTDLQRDNLGRLPIYGDIIIVDRGRGGFAGIDYPKEWELVASATMILLADLLPAEAAAFRYGFIHHGGPVAMMVFDRLRMDHSFWALPHDVEFDFKPDASLRVHEIDLGAVHNSWVTLRKALPECSIVSVGSSKEKDLASLTHWREDPARGNFALESIENLLHYQMHVIASYRWNHYPYLLEGIVNMVAAYQARNDWVRWLGLVRYCEYAWNKIGEDLPPQFGLEIKHQSQMCRATVPVGIQSKLESVPLAIDFLQYSWALDDCVAELN